jgi:chromate transporter
MSLQTLLWGALGLGPADWFQLFLHFALLSLLAVGGAITTVPDMHRYVVKQQAWLSDAQLAASVALAQAAPGPNVLFVAVIGFNVAGLAGMVATMTGTLLPSTTLALSASRWGRRHDESRFMRAVKVGLAPLSIGLLLTTAWLLLRPTAAHWGSYLLVALAIAVMLRTRISALWLIAAGAVAGLLEWV